MAMKVHLEKGYKLLGFVPHPNLRAISPFVNAQSPLTSDLTIVGHVALARKLRRRYNSGTTIYNIIGVIP